jgi:hypothetical protein
VEALVALFVSLGYQACEGPERIDGNVKIAIFGNEFGAAHVARQLASDEWTSKLGSQVDISHELTALEGRLYGRVVAFLEREIK